MTPVPPGLHFPSPYARPSVPPSKAVLVDVPDGARVATFVYEPEGPATSAVPVLMLHGNGEEHGIFGPTIDAVLETGRPVIAVDSRAQGKSTRGTARLTYELLADDALRCADAVGARRFHLLGFSDGAIEALLIARDHGARVASLVAVGANLTPDGVVDDGWDMDGIAAENEDWAAWADSPECHLPPELLSPTPAEARATADLLRLMVEEPHLEARSLSAIGCPTTVMVGEHDCIDDWETYRIVSAIPGATLYVSPENGHSLPKHAPGELTHVLLDTIAKAES